MLSSHLTSTKNFDIILIEKVKNVFYPSYLDRYTNWLSIPRGWAKKLNYLIKKFTGEKTHFYFVTFLRLRLDFFQKKNRICGTRSTTRARKRQIQLILKQNIYTRIFSITFSSDYSFVPKMATGLYCSKQF